VGSLPRISVVTPSFNQAQFLERTLRSVLDQGYPDLEYIVLDGGSTDGSVDIIRRYADRLDYWRSRADDGQTAAINEGWSRTNGEILAWLNSDDYYLPGTLPFVGEYFRDHPETRLLYGTCERVDPQGHSLGFVGSPFRMRDLLFSRQIIPQPSAFLHRELISAVGPLDPALRYSMDYDLFLRATQRSTPVFVDRPLAGATIHPRAKTTADRDPAYRETHRLRLKHSSGLGRLFVRFQPVQSWVYRRLPSPLRRSIDAFRPHRVMNEPRRTTGAR
jgi:glycosyltransferase involved in cell wall biosynthesis